MNTGTGTTRAPAFVHLLHPILKSFCLRQGIRSHEPTSTKFYKYAKVNSINIHNITFSSYAPIIFLFIVPDLLSYVVKAWQIISSYHTFKHMWRHVTCLRHISYDSYVFTDIIVSRLLSWAAPPTTANICSLVTIEVFWLVLHDLFQQLWFRFGLCYYLILFASYNSILIYIQDDTRWYSILVLSVHLNTWKKQHTAKAWSGETRTDLVGVLPFASKFLCFFSCLCLCSKGLACGSMLFLIAW